MTGSPALAQDVFKKSEPEQFVLSKLEQGQLADLNDCSASNKVLRATFIEQLLTTANLTLNRHGARNANATITNRLDLCDSDVANDAVFSGCTFTDETTFCNAHFRKCFRINRGRFLSDANFSGLIVDGDAAFDWADFYKQCSFAYAKCSRNLIATNSTFNKGTFQSIEVHGEFCVDSSTFSKDVSFDNAEITKDFSANEVHFAEASFLSMRVGGEFDIVGSVFSGRVDCTMADVQNAIHASRAHFLSTNSEVFFTAMHVGLGLFTDSEFKGPVSFRRSHFTGSFQASGASFSGRRPISMSHTGQP